MVTVTIEENQLIVSGKTYNFRDSLKELGGRWNPERKVWVVLNTGDNLVKVKAMKQTRMCGWCGKAGHFKPKCEEYKHHMREEEVRKAAAKRDKPGFKYKRFSMRPDCECEIRERKIDSLDLVVEEPFTCWGCNNYCCSEVVLCDNQSRHMYSERNYKCGRCMGSMTYQESETYRFMNDTSGT
jgi:hypothetical protein